MLRAQNVSVGLGVTVMIAIALSGITPAVAAPVAVPPSTTTPASATKSPPTAPATTKPGTTKPAPPPSTAVPVAPTAVTPAPVAVTASTLAPSGAVSAQAVATPSTATVTVTPIAGQRAFAFGVTHTQYSADDWGDVTATASARKLLSGQQIFQNQSIMGWGALNPEPSPGTFDWASLDSRMAMIQATHGIPVITLAGAPDWMKGGKAGTTDWGKIEVAPTADHYADFAELARRVALRYPGVRRFQVWNEMKGFWNYALGRWDYEGYTAMYNAVYDALKSVSPGIQVGGPYVSMTSNASGQGEAVGPWGALDQKPLDVITYWLAHKHGADFIAVDGSTSIGTDTATSSTLLTDPYTATQKFAAVNQWLRAKTSLPIWWSELYVQPPQLAWSQAKQSAVLSAAITQVMGSGAALALVWSPQQDTTQARPYLWTDARKSGGGKASALYTAFAAIVTAMKSSSPAANVTSSSPGLFVTGTQTRVLMVNVSGTLLNVRLPSSVTTLSPDEVRIATP